MKDTTTQADETTPRKEARTTGDMMPLLLHNAPSAFRARGFSLERLRKAYGIKRREALESVLAGLVLAVDRRPPASERDSARILPFRKTA